MYGLINKAVEGLVRSKFGDAMWDTIRTRAGLPDEPFLSMESYDDKTTYDIVAAASAELGAPPEAILEAFGRYWTIYTAEAGYGELLRSAGKTLPEFLKNLDQMHTRVKLSFPNLAPPTFTVTDETDSSLTLHYYSHRSGLVPLLVGLLKGLGERFELEIDVGIGRSASPKPHDLMFVTWKRRPAEMAG